MSGKGIALAITAHEAVPRVVGGAVGRTWGRHAEVQQLWVEKAHRREGLATRLMERFHAEAEARACDFFYLETWSFQAEGFYRKLGYETAFTIDGIGPGFAKHTMIRRAKRP